MTTPAKLTAAERAEDCVRHSRRGSITAVELRKVIQSHIEGAEQAARAERDRNFVGVVLRAGREGWRKGAEAMRRDCAEICKAVEKACTKDVGIVAALCSENIAKLPLPGGGGEV